MTAETKYYAGFEIDEARKRVLAALEADDLRRGEKTIEHTVGFDYKSDLPIQPLVKEQWFIKVQPFAERAIKVIEDEEVMFFPSGKKKVILQYLRNLHDWNISRQIPWGIPIPAFHNVEDPTDWIFDERVQQEIIEVNGKRYKREEDTFDTWFSSGQWPFVTTDVLQQGDLSRFYPTDMMETGHDLIDRWVARMIMLGLYVTDQIPFKHVYMHGMVLDEKGKKMSKSKGNVINPMDLIAQFGSDALRMGIIANRSAGQNQAFAIDKVVAGRNFCNKLWNIARYVEGKVGENTLLEKPSVQSLADHWIVAELTRAKSSVEHYIATYRFAEAADTVYRTIWHSVADWYIEATKREENISLMAWVLDSCLKIAHPFAPFVTETIWQAMERKTGLLISETWPEDMPTYSDIAAGEFGQLQELIGEIRYLTKELGKRDYHLLYQNDSLIEENADLLMQFTGLQKVTKTLKPHGLRLAVPHREVWLEVDEKTLKKHKDHLVKRIKKVEETISQLENRLQNESYVKNAPENLVNDSKQQLKDQTALCGRLQRELTIL